MYLFYIRDPVAIEARLSAQGIDVALYKQANPLRVYSIERSDENKRDVLSTIKAIRAHATAGMKPPFRFIGRTITDTTSNEGMQLGLVLEKQAMNISKSLTTRRCVIMTFQR